MALALAGCEDDTRARPVTLTNDGNGTAVANPTEGAKGMEITITATPNAEYVFARWVVEEGNVTLDDDTANPATFRMPARHVTIKAEFHVESGPAANEIGAIYYKDGKAVGVVFRAKNARRAGLAVALEENSTPERWSHSDFETLAGDEDDGAANMTAVQDYLTGHGMDWDELPPFHYVVTVMNGQTSWDAARDTWYLPARDEIRELAAAMSGKSFERIEEDWGGISEMPGYNATACVEARTAFNQKIVDAGGVELTFGKTSDDGYWTSSEISDTSVYEFTFHDGSAGADLKNTWARTRAILAF
jgi:hypothetical protein